MTFLKVYHVYICSSPITKAFSKQIQSTPIKLWHWDNRWISESRLAVCTAWFCFYHSSAVLKAAELNDLWEIHAAGCVPAALCGCDCDEWGCSQGEAGWSGLCCLGLWPLLAVVLLSLSEGQRRQLHAPTRQPADGEGLHAGQWTALRGLWQVWHLSEKQQS